MRGPTTTCSRISSWDTRSGAGVTAGEILRHGGSFDRANTAMACSLAADRSPAELLDEFGRLVYRPRGLGRIFPPRLLLGDHITHELDILFAIDREPDIAGEAVVAVLNTQVALPNPFVPAFRNSRGLRLRATDVDWAHGDSGAARRGKRGRTRVRSGQPAANAACAAR